jgi:hypothetical protein
MAAVGERVIDGTAKMRIKRFFDQLRDELAEGQSDRQKYGFRPEVFERFAELHQLIHIDRF